MPLSYTQYTGNGATTDFLLSFQYINKLHVIVRVNNAITPYTWVNDSTIRISPAPGQQALVWIYRMTPYNMALTTFQDNVGFREKDLNRLTSQLLYVMQEVYESVNIPVLAEWREEIRQGLEEMREIQASTSALVANFQALVDSAETILDDYAVDKTLLIEQAAEAAITHINETTTGLSDGMLAVAAARQEIAAARTLIEQLTATAQAHKEDAAASATAANTSKETAQSTVITVQGLKSDVTQLKTDTDGIKTQTDTLRVQTAAIKGQVETLLADAQAVKGQCDTILTQTQTVKNDTDTLKAAAETAKTQAQGFATNASASASAAQSSASSAAASAQVAFGAEAAAWVSGASYSFPQVVAGSDGHSYRCVGTGIQTNPINDAGGWTRITVTPPGTFEHDVSGNLMPSNPPVVTSEWDIDGDGNIMPKE